MSSNSGDVYAWGAQLEQSSTVGEYIPTTSTINSAPRFDHKPITGESLGLLVEESRTNNVLQSEDFATTWTLNNINVSTNSVVAPDGTATADTIAPPTDGLTITRFLRQNPALTTQQAYTLSVFVKAGTATTNGIGLYVSDSTATNNFRSNFNLFNLTTSPAGSGWATPTATIVPYPNGWYRCILSGVTSTAHTSLRANIYLSFFGNVADTYGSIHIWGAQLEAGAFPTSYIPTTSSTVTRAADVASISDGPSGSNFSSWYNQAESTAYWEGSRATTTGFPDRFRFSDGTNANRWFSYWDGANNSSTFQVITGSASQVAIYGGAPTLNSPIKTAFGVIANNVSAVYAGSVQGTDTSAAVPSVSQVVIGTGFTGTIGRLTYWPQCLSNETLQRITQ
jgi:hypothetical protein